MQWSQEETEQFHIMVNRCLNENEIASILGRRVAQVRTKSMFENIVFRDGYPVQTPVFLAALAKAIKMVKADGYFVTRHNDDGDVYYTLMINDRPTRRLSEYELVKFAKVSFE